MAYGTPATPDDVEAYYTHIRRGQPADRRSSSPTSSRRYDAIGGISPLAERTEAQRPALAAALDAAGARPCRVVLGQKHAAPFIEDAVADAGRRGRRPRSSGSCSRRTTPGSRSAQYQERLADGRRAHGLPVAAIDSWHLEPTYVDFLAGAVRDGARRRCPSGTKVLFTAHSLPGAGAGRRPVPRPAPRVGRRGRRGGRARPMGGLVALLAVRGPHPRAVARARHPRGASATWPRTGRADGVLVCPQGFVSDHLEVVYDLDIEARRRRRRGRAAFARTRVLNDDPTVLGGPRRPGAAQAARDATSSSSAAASPGWSPRRETRPGPGRRSRSSNRAASAARCGRSAVRRRPCSTRPPTPSSPACPRASSCAATLGLDGDLVSPAVRRAHVWSRGALRLLPEGAGARRAHRPRRAGAHSAILSPGRPAPRCGDGPRPAPRRAGAATSPSARVVRDRLGDEALERLVDPLVGGINAGDTDRLSLAATVPAARRGRPQRRRVADRGVPRPARAGAAIRDAPVFFAPRAGMGALVEALVADLAARGVTAAWPACRRPRLERGGGGWRVTLGGARRWTRTASCSRRRRGPAAASSCARTPPGRHAAGGDPLRVGRPREPGRAAGRGRPGARRQRVPRAPGRGSHRHGLLVDVGQVAAPARRRHRLAAGVGRPRRRRRGARPAPTTQLRRRRPGRPGRH